MAPKQPAGSRRDRPAAPREALRRARLYLVVDSAPAHGTLRALLEAAARGGVDVVQLREKELPDRELAEAGREAQAQCERLGMLFVLNDRPDLARAIGADGVHVGQDDMAVAQARAIVGPDAVLGLSTHAPAEVDAADPALVDYIGVGPIHETPTKPGRPAVGLELVSYAAAAARVPFFAIGGLDATNVDEVLGAGARRVCVLRAIAAAQDPEAAARAIAERLPALARARQGATAYAGAGGED